MDKWIKKLSGAVIASVLALTLSSKAYAEDTEGDTLSGEDSKTNVEIVESVDAVKSDGTTAEQASTETDVISGSNTEEGTGEGEVTTSGEGAEDVSDEGTGENTDGASGESNASASPAVSLFSVSDTDSLTSLDDTVATDDTTAAAGLLTDTAVGDTDPTGADAAATTTVDDSESITIVDGGTTTVIDPEEQKEIPKTTDDDSDGFWGYDTGDSDAASDDSVYMVNYQADSITAENCDLTIEAAGLNQIGTITAEKNLTISGTGIMLIDDLSINGQSFDTGASMDGFFLKPLDGLNYNGSVAVFLRSKRTTENSSYYELINGDVTGILDEQYVIPSGIHLMMPGGTNIELVCPEITYSKTDDSILYGQQDVVSSSLTLSSGSSLIVNSGATVKMSGKLLESGTVASSGKGSSGVLQAPVLDVDGKLTLAGNITGTGIVILETETSDSVTSQIGPNIFKIYKTPENHVIRLDSLKSELFTYLTNQNLRTFSSADKALIFNSDETDWHKGITPVFPVFALTIGNNKTILANDGDHKSYSGNLTLFQWWLSEGGIGGGEDITVTLTGSTGSGILGGKNAGPAQLTANHSLILKVTDKTDFYHLSAYLDGQQIFKLGNKVTVRFDYPAPAAEGQLFAVFRNADGSLTAFPARYDAITGQLVFSGDKLGNFVVVCIDYEGELYTKEFYDLLETIESVANLKYGL